MLIDMIQTPKYDFRPVMEADHAMLKRWRRSPHVLEWWGQDDPEEEALMARPLVRRWIVSYGGRPFAYMQDYAVQGWEFDHYFAHLPKGARGIDQYIGEREMLGQGHGVGFIKTRVDALCRAGVPVVATDPHPDNQRAISVYEKVGFRIFGDVIESKWGRILPMKIEC